MMQLAYGMSAAQSGMMTIATAMGALAMKGLAGCVLRRFGFRTSLIVVGILATAGYATCGLFRPDRPLPAPFAVMAVSGFFMSLQFTAYNTIAYDEIDTHWVSQATSFCSTIQHLMLSAGICVSATALHLSMAAPAGSCPDLPISRRVLDGHRYFAAGDRRQRPVRPSRRRGNGR